MRRWSGRAAPALRRGVRCPDPAHRGGASAPDGWEVGFDLELVERIAEAERYEDGCWEAIEASGIEDRKEEAESCVATLYRLADAISQHPPCTGAGVLIHARALAGYSDVDKNGLNVSVSMKASTMLGRGLADAVLRVAGVKA